jgi:hypothetical protein
MPIPDAQLQTWSNPGAEVIAQQTYASVQAALDAPASSARNKDKEIFLQGSYRNSTNIYGDMDVDIVARCNDVWGRDLALLPQEQVQAYFQTYETATYSWEDFRADVLASLRAYYGAGSVTEGPKSLKVAAAPGRLAADVVPALTYKRFNYFVNEILQDYVEGIRFRDRRDGREIVNYPKQHTSNGQAKNGDPRTGGHYKPTVRMFKNARSRLITDGVITRVVAPSYFVECLVYNAPDPLFVAGRQAALRGVLQWLVDNPLPPLLCQNGIVRLFGPTAEQWSVPNATAFINALTHLWNNW